MSILDKLTDIAKSPFGAIFNPTLFITAQTTPKEAYYPALVIAGSTYGVLYAVGAVVIGSFLTRKKPEFPAQAGAMQRVLMDPVSPWRLIYGQMRVGGVITFMEVTNRNYDLHQVITLAAHECEEMGGIYLNDQLATLDADGVVVTPAKWAGAITIQKSDGSEAAGVQPFPDLVAISDGLWTDLHCQTGHAKIYVKYHANDRSFTDGIPRVTCVVKGKKVRDPRTSPINTAWSDNAALCAADYLCSSFGLEAVYADEIDEAVLIAAANICDQQVALAGSPTVYESRYEANGVITADRTPRDVLAELNTAKAAPTRFIGGKWQVNVGAWPTPEATALTADDLRAGLSVSPRLSRRDLCNGVKGLYLNPDNFWQPSDFPPVTNATYLSQDNDERIWKDIALQFTTSGSMAQRIAKIELERTRQQGVITWPGKLTCYRLQPGDVVPVTFSKFGYAAKVFEVVSSSLAIGEDGAIGCDLILRETASTIYDWSAEETAVDSAPDSNLPDTLQPSDITGFIATQNGTVVVFSCDQVPDRDLDGVEIRIAAQGITDWDQATAITSILRGNTSTSAGIAPGDWTFFAKARDTAGNYSDAAVTYDLTVTSEGYTAVKDVEQAEAWTELRELDYELSLPSATSYVLVPADADMSVGSGDFSVAVTFTQTSAVANAFLLNNSFSYGWQVQLPDGVTGKLRIGMGAPGGTSVGLLGESTDWVVGQEYHLAITFDRDGLCTAYKDGAVFDAFNISTASGDLGSNAFAFGNNVLGSSSSFLCTMSKVSLYNRVLSQSEVEQLYGGEQVNSGLLGRWPLNDGSGSTALDDSGNGNNGTLSGGATWAALTSSATFIPHHTGVLIVESTKAASAHTIAELFEQFVPYPVATAICPSAEVDKSVDGTLRVRSVVNTRAGRDHTDGDVKPQFQLDYKLAAGSYDGFEDWAAGQANFRYCKGQLVLDTSMGVPVIEGFEIIVDGIPRSEVLTSQNIGASGSAITFGTPFNSIPSIQITPVGTTPQLAGVESPTTTGFTAHLYNRGTGAGEAGTANIISTGP